MNLLSAAGLQSGIGDGRQEKGWGNFGSFVICEPNDKDFLRITSTMGREPQKEGLREAEAYDNDTLELLSWFQEEVKNRGFKAAS